MKYAYLYFIGVFTLIYSCKESTSSANFSEPSESQTNLDDSIQEPMLILDSPSETPTVIDYDTTLWKELTPADDLIIDLRYATENNFTHSKIYPCGRCFIRPVIAERVLQINQQLIIEKKWQLKLFDCYRPRPAQYRLWEKHPNETHVMHPSKGSMHNRGAAVDLTIVSIDGNEINMGTDFDDFGREARHDYLNLPDQILENRNYLKTLMEAQGFKSIKSEWWHYSLSGQGSALSNWEWPCP